MAQDNHPAYDQAFYDAIIAERRKLGATGGYVDIDECMTTMGREYFAIEDNRHSVENERA